MGFDIEIKKLYANIGKLITSSLTLDEILEGIMEEVRMFFSPDNWSLMRLDPNTNELFFVIASGIDLKKVEHVRMKPGEGIAGIVAKTGSAIFVPDTSKDRRFSGKVDRITGFATKSIIAVPLTFRNTVYGVIELINRDSGAFTEDEHIILQTIAEFSAIAFANAILYEKAILISNTDPLTGLYNRTKLESIISETTKSGGMLRRKDDLPLYAVVITIDIDNFKEINDNFGHREGDRMLKETSTRIRACLRSNDLFFRIGGDEFLILITEQNHERLIAIKERVTGAIAKSSRFTIRNGFEVRFSFGSASGPLSQIRELIHRADLEMYDRKNSAKKA